MPIVPPLFSHNLSGQLCCYGVPLMSLLEHETLEFSYYLMLMQKKPTPKELELFHVQAKELRAQTVREIVAKQSMYAPALNTLQSLSACITVTYHDWDYLNQLLVTYSSFFQDELFYYENYDQQLWKLATGRQVIDDDYRFFQKIIMLLGLSCYKTPLEDIVRKCALAQVSLPMLIATAVGYNSGKKETQQLYDFFSFFNHASLMTIEKKIKKYLKNKWDIPGFHRQKQPSDEFYTYYISILLRDIIQNHKEAAPFFEVVSSAMSFLKKEDLELDWLCLVGMGLSFIGVEEKMQPSIISIAQIPGWMAVSQYELGERF